MTHANIKSAMQLKTHCDTYLSVAQGCVMDFHVFLQNLHPLMTDDDEVNKVSSELASARYN